MLRGLLGLALVLVLGCSGPYREDAVEGDEWVAEEVASTLEVAMLASSVRLLLHVTNATEEPLDFTFPTSQRYDFVVEDGSGTEVWRWSEDRAFLQVITEARLEPGETWTMEAVWEPGDRSGEHAATGRLVAMDRPVEQRMSFEVP
jgi:hypothetical protein